MPHAGLLLQVDGSPRHWLVGRGPRMTLVGGIDEATGAVTAKAIVWAGATCHIPFARCMAVKLPPPACSLAAALS